MSLAEDESKEYEKVYNSIADFLKKHAEENEYSVVLTYSRSNPTVLYADSKLDITTEVLEGLNKEYKENKETKIRIAFQLEISIFIKTRRKIHVSNELKPDECFFREMNGKEGSVVRWVPSSIQEYNS